MSAWSEVFVDDSVRHAAQRYARNVILSFGLFSAVLVCLAPLVTLFVPEFALAIAFVGLSALSVSGAWVVHRLNPVQRRVWHVELSIREAVFIDVQGHRHGVLWPRIERLNLTDGGLTFVSRDRDGMIAEYHVPSAFCHYAAMSHRAVEYAEALRRPVCVDGQPWQSLDLRGVFPFLGAEEPNA